MGFYSTEIVQMVRLERQKGITLKVLAAKYSIPPTTISRWVRDIPVEFSSFDRARKREAMQKEVDKSLVKKEKLLNTRVLLALLYWCEGSKYPATNFLAFTNSDEHLIKTFLQLLRSSFSIQEEKLRVQLQIHESHNVDKTIQFWSTLLRIHPEQFYPPTITKAGHKRKRRNYVGTCTIRYYDVKLLLQITGIFEEFARVYGEVAEWPKAEDC